MQMVYTHTAKHFGNDSLFDLAKYYREYLNNFVSLNKWADSLGCAYEDAPVMLQLCKHAHEAGF